MMVTADTIRWVIAVTALASVFILGLGITLSWRQTNSPTPWRAVILTFIAEQCALALSSLSAARDPHLDDVVGVPWRLWLLLVAVVIVDVAGLWVLRWTSELYGRNNQAMEAKIR